jgi:hypothetical protein
VTQKGSIKRKPKSVVEAPAKGQESEKKVSFETGGRKASQQESQVDITGHILDQAFLVRINASWSSWKHQLWGGGGTRTTLFCSSPDTKVMLAN